MGRVHDSLNVRRRRSRLERNEEGREEQAGGEGQADGAGLGLSLGSQCYVDICGTLLEAYRAMLHVAYFHMSRSRRCWKGGRGKP